MRNQVWRSAAFVAAAAMLIGCPERDERFDETPAVTGPWLSDGSAVYLSGARRAALVLDPDDSSFAVIPLSGTPLSGTVVPETGELAVLIPSEDTLDVVDPKAKTSRSYDLGSAFDALSLSSDGRFGLASFAGGASSVLANAAEVSIIDLEADPSDKNPTTRTIASAGGAPLGIDISPEFGPTKRRIAIVRSINHLAAIDLTQPGGATRSIPLVSPGSGAQVVPQEIEFTVRAEQLDAFVRVAGLNDVYHLRFDGTQSEEGAPFPVLNQFAVGSSPADLLLWTGSDDHLRLMAINSGSKDLTIIDVDSAEDTTFSLGTAVNRVLMYTGASGKPEALIYADGNQSAAFYRVALEDIAVKKSKAVTKKSLVAPIQHLEPAAKGAWFMVTHAAGFGASVTLVEAAGGRIIPFTGAGTVMDQTVSADGDQIYLLLNNGGRQLAVIDIASGHPESMTVDGLSANSVDVIPNTDWLLLNGSHQMGSLGLVRAGEVEDGEAAVIKGFAVTGIFDEEEAE